MKKAVIFSLIFWILILGALTAAPVYILTRELIPTPDLFITGTVASDVRGAAIVPTAAESEPPPEPVEIVLSFVGDCMLATHLGGEWDLSFNKIAKAVEPSYFFENFIEMFTNDDWTIANLENVFTDNPAAATKAKNHSPAYWYKSTTANTAILNAGGIDVVSIANNHSTDYGDIGYADTCAALEEADILWGDDGHIVWLEKEGFTIALFCCTFYNDYYEAFITDKLVATEADYKIVYFHGGTEREHVPDYWKSAGARRLIDNGADLVIGHHPHVLQPVEIYNGKTIIHSLGNFVFGGSRNEENRTIVYRRTLTLLEGELVDEADEIIPCYVYTDIYKPGIIENEAEIEAVFRFLRGESESPLK